MILKFFVAGLVLCLSACSTTEKLASDASTYRVADKLGGASGMAGVAVLGTLLRITGVATDSGQYCHESKDGCKMPADDYKPKVPVVEEAIW